MSRRKNFNILKNKLKGFPLNLNEAAFVDPDNLLEGLSTKDEFQQNGLFCDVTLIAELDGTRIPCHRVILSASSKFFYYTFKVNPGAEVPMSAVSGDTLNAIVNFIYTGKLEIDPSTAIDVARCAHRYRLETLSECCQRYLMKKVINLSNFGSLCELTALSAEHQALSVKLKDFFVENFMIVHESECLIKMNFEQLKEFLTYKTILNVSGKTIFEAMKKWLHYEPDRIKHAKYFQDCLRSQISQLSDKNVADQSFVDKEVEAEEAADQPLVVNEIETAEAADVSLVDNEIETAEAADESLVDNEIETAEAAGESLVDNEIETAEAAGESSSDEPPNVSGNTSMCFHCFGDAAESIQAFNRPLSFKIMISYEGYCITSPTNFAFEKCKHTEYSSMCMIGDDLWIIGGTICGHDTDFMSKMNMENFAVTPMIGLMGNKRSHAGIVHHGNCIYLVSGQFEDYALVNRVDKFDIQLSKWFTVAPMAEALRWPKCVVHKDSIFAVGGQVGKNWMNTVERYDIANDKWFRVASLPDTGSGTASVSSLDGDLIVVMCVGLVLQYDEINDKWFDVNETARNL